MASANPVTDHDTIRRWAEDRGGRPAKVDTGGDGGVLRFDFGAKEDNLTEIEWDEFFQILDDNELAVMLVENDRDSRFSKFVARSGGDARQ